MIRIPGNNLIYYYCTKVPKKITYVAIHTIGQFVLDRMIFFITKPTSVQFFQEEEKQDRIGWKLFSCIQTTSDQRSPCISLVTWLLVWCHPTGRGGGGGGVCRHQANCHKTSLGQKTFWVCKYNFWPTYSQQREEDGECVRRRVCKWTVGLRE